MYVPPDIHPCHDGQGALILGGCLDTMQVSKLNAVSDMMSYQWSLTINGIPMIHRNDERC